MRLPPPHGQPGNREFIDHYGPAAPSSSTADLHRGLLFGLTEHTRKPQFTPPTFPHRCLLAPFEYSACVALPLSVESPLWPSRSTAHRCQHPRHARPQGLKRLLHALSHCPSAIHPVHPSVLWTLHTHGLPSVLLRATPWLTMQRFLWLIHALHPPACHGAEVSVHRTRCRPRVCATACPTPAPPGPLQLCVTPRHLYRMFHQLIKMPCLMTPWRFQPSRVHPLSQPLALLRGKDGSSFLLPLPQSV